METYGPSQSYTVRPGDTLWGISQQFLGGGQNWHGLYDNNRQVVGGNPNLIRPGQVLNFAGAQRPQTSNGFGPPGVAKLDMSMGYDPTQGFNGSTGTYGNGSTALNSPGLNFLPPGVTGVDQGARQGGQGYSHYTENRGPYDAHDLMNQGYTTIDYTDQGARPSGPGSPYYGDRRSGGGNIGLQELGNGAFRLLQAPFDANRQMPGVQVPTGPVSNFINKTFGDMFKSNPDMKGRPGYQRTNEWKRAHAGDASALSGLEPITPSQISGPVNPVMDDGVPLLPNTNTNKFFYGTPDATGVQPMRDRTVPPTASFNPRGGFGGVQPPQQTIIPGSNDNLPQAPSDRFVTPAQFDEMAGRARPIALADTSFMVNPADSGAAQWNSAPAGTKVGDTFFRDGQWWQVKDIHDMGGQVNLPGQMPELQASPDSLPMMADQDLGGQLSYGNPSGQLGSGVPTGLLGAGQLGGLLGTGEVQGQVLPWRRPGVFGGFGR
jgi:hypothetical protein